MKSQEEIDRIISEWKLNPDLFDKKTDGVEERNPMKEYISEEMVTDFAIYWRLNRIVLPYNPENGND